MNQTLNLSKFNNELNLTDIEKYEIRCDIELEIVLFVDQLQKYKKSYKISYEYYINQKIYHFCISQIYKIQDTIEVDNMNYHSLIYKMREYYEVSIICKNKCSDSIKDTNV